MRVSDPISVLIVASEADYSVLTARLGSRYKIRHSIQGTDALKMIDRLSIDVLVASELLPDMSGADLITKAETATSKIASIIIHEQFAPMSAQARELVMVEHLNKPVGEFTLMKAIDEAGARLGRGLAL